MKYGGVIALLVALATASAGAQAKNQSATADELVRVVVVKTPFDRAVREQFAHALSAHCKELLRVIPRNTPKEEDWVTGELHTTDSNRIERALTSIEYSRRLLVEVFTACIDQTSNLIRTSSSLPVRERAIAEAIQWSELALTFDNYRGDLKSHAAQVGLLQVNNKESDIYAFWILNGLSHSLTQASLAVLYER